MTGTRRARITLAAVLEPEAVYTDLPTLDDDSAVDWAEVYRLVQREELFGEPVPWRIVGYVR